MKMGLRDANQHFSKVVKAVRAGKEVVLTERGRPIAVIKPIQPANTPEAALQALRDAGLLLPAARQKPMPLPRWRPLKVQGKRVSQTIIEDREDRF
jgi:prevent-host-death family protein